MDDFGVTNTFVSNLSVGLRRVGFVVTTGLDNSQSREVRKGPLGETFWSINSKELWVVVGFGMRVVLKVSGSFTRS